MKNIIRPLVFTFFFTSLVLPLVSVVTWAFSAGWRFPSLLPSAFSGRGFAVAVDPSSEVMRGVVTSTLIALIVGVIATIIGSAAGRGIALYNFRGKALFQFLVLAPLIVPSLAVTMGIQVLFIKYGLADTIQGVVIVHLIPTVPYVVMIMTGTFSNFEYFYEEQARVLGAKRFFILRKITIPLVFPGIAISFLFAFVISWSEYILTLLVGGGVVKTLPLLLFAYLRGSDLTLAAAISLIFMLPPLVLLKFTSKYLVGQGSSVTGLGSV